MKAIRRRHLRGFTLVEMLVSLVILGIGIVGVSQLYLAGVQSYQKARYLSIATQRAQKEIESAQRVARDGYAGLFESTTYPSAMGYTFSQDPDTKVVTVNFPVPGLLNRTKTYGDGTITITKNPNNISSDATTGAKIASVAVNIKWYGTARPTPDEVKLFTLVTDTK